VTGHNAQPSQPTSRFDIVDGKGTKLRNPAAQMAM
jgi:hypothetical protein